MRSLVALLVVAIPWKALAADVVSIFDDQSFRVGLTLPFTVAAVKNDSSARIHRVTVVDPAGTGKCLAMPDPKIAANFVLKCEEVANVSLKILIAQGERATEYSYGPIQIKELKAGYREPSAGGGSVVDPDIAAGRQILFSKTQSASAGGRACVGCHAKPSTYPRIMLATAQTLQTLSGNPSMPGVPSLSAAEAAKVVKYLSSIVDSGEWP